ncbi:MAG TPA: transaldolase, partial [Rhodanobacteraceae bacterium]|nr:transaldolase [Rhodanobacteraceae bacterium]
MNATRQLHDLGQSLWLDNITRGILDDGTLERHIKEYTLTGLTSNPTIFDKAISGTETYDDAIREKAGQGKSGETLFVELALEDLRRAAKLFKPVHESTHGMDGWVSMEVSPLLANDTAATIEAAASIHHQAACDNLFVKIPGTPEGVPAIEESIFAGVPVNVTLLFSSDQYQAVAEAYMRGIERRIEAGLSPKVASVASVFISRWDVAVKDEVPEDMHNKLGIAIAGRVYRAYLDTLASERWQKLAKAGAQPQRLLWASTGTKDPKAPDTLYVTSLAAPDTINTMPGKTIEALADHGELHGAMSTDSSEAEAMLKRFVDAGVDIDALAHKLQVDGAASFVKSWKDLLDHIAEQSKALT